MCGGDGLADLVGRKFGSAKLPFNKNKSWAGSLAMFVGELFCLWTERLSHVNASQSLGESAVITAHLQVAQQLNIERAKQVKYLLTARTL